MGQVEEWAYWLDQRVTDPTKDVDEGAPYRWATAVSHWLIDATLLTDTDSLEVGQQRLRTAYRNFHPTEARGTQLATIMTVLAETIQAGLDRARQARLEQTLEPGSWAAKVLIKIDQEPDLNNTQLSLTLGTGETQISRTARALSGYGLVVSSRYGRQNAWRTTPRGAGLVEQLLRRSNPR
jgi:hypothetical protein